MIQPDEIIRSRRKTLSICVDPFGRLIVRAPLTCTEERIFDFIQKKERWILQKKAEAAAVAMQTPPENLHGYEFLLLGKKCRIVLTDSQYVRFDEGSYTIYLPSKNARTRLVQWLKENGKRIFTKVTERKAKEMGVTFQSVKITSARGKWGSCSYNNEIEYTFRLIYAPKDVIEYVVVHELSHVRQKNHSRLFWALVARYVPDWKEKRKWLRDRNILMEIF